MSGENVPSVDSFKDTNEAVQALWNGVRGVREAVEFMFLNLKDAGIGFENDEQITFWLKDASEWIDARLDE